MKKEYDFSNGERGKFYNKDATFNLPIYFEPSKKAKNSLGFKEETLDFLNPHLSRVTILSVSEAI